MKRDYFEVLGLSRSAGEDEIKRAYRQLALKYHPDRNKDPDATEKFKEIKEAYEVLIDPKRRRAYERFGHAAVTGSGAGATPGFEDFGFGSIFDTFETFFGGTGSRRGPTRGTDLRYDLTLSFEEAVFGVEKEIEVPRWVVCEVCGGTGADPDTPPERCPDCNGSGELRRVQQTIFGSFVGVQTCPRCGGEGRIVTKPCATCRGQGRTRVVQRRTIAIPAGVDDGQSLNVPGWGEVPARGGVPGDLYVVLNVKPHKVFQRQGVDIILEQPLNVAQAALGTELEIPLVDGGTETIRVPAGTQHGRVITLRGKGVPYLNGNGRGDMKVRLRVAIPTSLTDEQRRLFRELARSFGTDNVGGGEGGIFEKVKRGFKDLAGTPD